MTHLATLTALAPLAATALFFYLHLGYCARSARRERWGSPAMRIHERNRRLDSLYVLVVLTAVVWVAWALFAVGTTYFL